MYQFAIYALVNILIIFGIQKYLKYCTIYKSFKNEELSLLNNQELLSIKIYQIIVSLIYVISIIIWTYIDFLIHVEPNIENIEDFHIQYTISANIVNAIYHYYVCITIAKPISYMNYLNIIDISMFHKILNILITAGLYYHDMNYYTSYLLSNVIIWMILSYKDIIYIYTCATNTLDTNIITKLPIKYFNILKLLLCLFLIITIVFDCMILYYMHTDYETKTNIIISYAIYTIINISLKTIRLTDTIFALNKTYHIYKKII